MGSGLEAYEMSELDLDAIEARAMAASKEPWSEHTDGSFGIHDGTGEDIFSSRLGRLARAGHTRRRANEHFAAHARTDVPAMAREIRRLRKEARLTKAFCENVIENFDCDCDELDEPAAICFWCQAKEAVRPLPAPPEVKP